MPSLYERLGGEAAVTAAVDIFYGKVMADQALKPFFDGVDMAQQKRKQHRFLSMAFGGPNHYSGVGLRNAHKKLVLEKGLADVHFDLVAKHLGDTLQELKVPQKEIGEVLQIAGSTRNDVLNR